MEESNRYEIYGNEVCSSTYQEMFEQVYSNNGLNITSDQSRMLMSYPNDLCWYTGEKKLEIIDRFRRTHMDWFIKWLIENENGKPPYKTWNDTIDRLLLHFSNLFLRIDLGDLIISEDVRIGFRKLADAEKIILMTMCQSNPVAIDQSGLTHLRQLLLNLFYLTVDGELAIYLKSLGLVDLMNLCMKISNNDDEVQLQAYRILAVVLSESDLKELQNVRGIASVFLNFISKSIQTGITSIGRLQNTLRGLKVLCQHEEIREELIKLDSQQLMFKCILNSGYDLIKVKLPAMEILLSLSFNQTFATRLKENKEFVDSIRNLVTSTEAEVQKVSTGLLWKLEKEFEDNKKTDEKKSSANINTSTQLAKKYDIMISYCHQNKDLCQRIYTKLVQDNYVVWIDSQLMHGATFDAMAEAIENCRHVLICMSDAYKQSAFCEMEASYAVKCRCHIIPIVMTHNYKADGWLGILTAKYLYVDFPKLGIDNAYGELKRLLNLHTSTNKPIVNKISEPSHSNILLNTKPENPPVLLSTTPRIPKEYPTCLDHWTEEHVKSFLIEKQLEVFLPILESMNGALVHQVYNMCQTNQQAMFLSCKEDISRYHRAQLTLKDYLTFLNEIKKYIPYTDKTGTNPTSVLCSLM